MIESHEMNLPVHQAPVPPAGVVRLATVTLIRWVAVCGQAVTILFVHYGLGFSLPLVPALAAVAASALLNVIIALRRPAEVRIGERAAAAFLAFDVAQLAGLLYLTGGLENPFSLLLLAPVTVSATILSRRSTLALCLTALAAISVLSVWHLPLPWSAGGFSLPLVYVAGAWVALALGLAFFASYTFRVAEEARRMSDALAATQMALAREQRLSALGGLAAAAAHELGSPLGTIAVATREIARELPPDSPIAEDVELLTSEIGRCRDILAELAVRPEGDDGGPYSVLPVDALVDEAIDRHLDDRIEVVRDSGALGDDGAPAPFALRRAEIIHGLGNLVQNAVQFARRSVHVATRWSDGEIVVTIRDDGAGFPIRLLERLGEPYISIRATEGDHMGLGIFIARTLLQRTGAEVAFGNAADGGAEIVVRWRRDALEVAAQPVPQLQED